MKLARAARLLVAVALLAAQQAALGHQIWHLGKHDSQPAQKQLCEQHAALATVAGALDCTPSGPVLAAADDVPLPFVASRAAAAPGLVPCSRGPPTLL